MNLQTLKTLLIDGDGVLWRAKTPMPGLVRFFDVLAKRSINWALVTNNATRTLDHYLDKLAGFGVTARPDQIFSSASVTASLMQKRYAPGDPIYVIGGKGIKHSLAEAGFTIYDGEQSPDRAVAVVASMDLEFSYRKLAIAMRLIRNGAAFLATNPDRTFPTPDGLVPGAGSIVAALVAATDVTPEVVGKPETAIFEAAVQHLKADPATTAMLGDRMETDILGARRAGIGAILVLSGVTSREQLAHLDYQPDLIFDDIGALADALESLGA